MIWDSGICIKYRGERCYCKEDTGTALEVEFVGNYNYMNEEVVAVEGWSLDVPILKDVDTRELKWAEVVVVVDHRMLCDSDHNSGRVVHIDVRVRMGIVWC